MSSFTADLPMKRLVRFTLFLLCVLCMPSKLNSSATIGSISSFIDGSNMLFSSPPVSLDQVCPQAEIVKHCSTCCPSVDVLREILARRGGCITSDDSVDAEEILRCEDKRKASNDTIERRNFIRSLKSLWQGGQIPGDEDAQKYNHGKYVRSALPFVDIEEILSSVVPSREGVELSLNASSKTPANAYDMLRKDPYETMYRHFLVQFVYPLSSFPKQMKWLDQTFVFNLKVRL